MSTNQFWHQRQLQPKRNFRWVATVGNGEKLYRYTVKSVAKPTWTTTEKTHSILGHTFKYPGPVTWNTVDIVFMDLAGDQNDRTKGNGALFLQDVIYASGYQFPTSIGDATLGVTKGRATTAMGGLEVEQLDAEGKILELYTFHNPFISSVNFGDGWSYDSDEFSTITMTISYDWAKITQAAGGKTISADAASRLARMGLSDKTVFAGERPAQSRGDGGTY